VTNDKNLRFFARSATETGLAEQSLFAFSDYSTQWLIEGNIRQKQDKFRVSLSLVDTKTALVVYSLTQDLDNDPSQLKKISASFISTISQVLTVDD